MEEYKGLYYNEVAELKYYEGGAHFKYKDLYRLLEELSRKENYKKIPKNLKPVSKFFLIIKMLINIE